MPSLDSDPGELAARCELAELIAEAAGTLSDPDRAVLELAYRHGLDGADLAVALEVSAARARAKAVRLRQNIESSLGALLVARRARHHPGACLELAQILDGWDGGFTNLIRKRITRHIESCPTCEQTRRKLVTPAALLGSPPVFIPAPDWLRAQTLRRVRLIKPTVGTPAPSGPVVAHADSAAAEHRGRRRHLRLLGLIALLTVTACVGLGLGVKSSQQQLPNINAARSNSPATTFETVGTDCAASTSTVSINVSTRDLPGRDRRRALGAMTGMADGPAPRAVSITGPVAPTPPKVIRLIALPPTAPGTATANTHRPDPSPPAGTRGAGKGWPRPPRVR